MNISVVIQHTLGAEQAKSRIQLRMDKLLASFGDGISNVEEEWLGNIMSIRFDTAAGPVSGTLAVGESEVILDVRLPMLAWFVQNKIKRQIRDELEICLE